MSFSRMKRINPHSKKPLPCDGKLLAVFFNEGDGRAGHGECVRDRGGGRRYRSHSSRKDLNKKPATQQPQKAPDVSSKVRWLPQTRRLLRLTGLHFRKARCKVHNAHLPPAPAWQPNAWRLPPQAWSGSGPQRSHYRKGCACGCCGGHIPRIPAWLRNPNPAVDSLHRPKIEQYPQGDCEEYGGFAFHHPAVDPFPLL